MVARRKRLSRGFIEYTSRIIADKLIQSEQFKKAKAIACYYPLGKEVSTVPFIGECFKANKTVLIPRVTDGTNMVFEKISPKLELKSTPGYCFLKEPVNGESFDPDKIDWYIVPAISGDFQGNRIGKGYGFFDNYFAKHNHKVNAITMIIFDDFLFNRINKEDSDVPVDNIFTERKIIDCKKFKIT